ncbi:MAG: hypothetical protein ACYDHX_07515 [Methanothrix sp.]
MLDSSVKTSTRGTFLETADLLRKGCVNVPLIIGGGATDGAIAGQRGTWNMLGCRGRWWRCWMRLCGSEGNEPRPFLGKASEERPAEIEGETRL